MGNKNVKKIVELRAPSDLDDILCRDGEIINGEWLFPNEKPSDSESTGGAGQGSTPTLVLKESYVTLPDFSEVFLAHKVDEGCNVIYSDSSGNLKWIGNHYGRGTLAVAGVAGKVREIVDIGVFLVINSDRGLLFAYWNHSVSDYVWLGSVPEAPAVKARTVPKALPPYSYVDGDMPVFIAELKVEDTDVDPIRKWLAGTDTLGCPSRLKDNVRNAVAESMRDFLKDVENAGLWFQRLYLSMAWKSSETIWGYSPEVSVGISDRLYLKINAVSHSAGIFRLQLVLSRSPYCVSVDNVLDSLSKEWRSVVDGIRVFVSREVESFGFNAVSDAIYLDASARGFEIYPLPASTNSSDFVRPEMTPFFELNADKGAADIFRPAARVFSVLDRFDLPSIPPDFIRNINSRLVSVWTHDSENRRNKISVSASFLPFAATGENEISGEKIINLSHSLRPLSSGQLGQFPLHAFASDGIRALAPNGTSFSDVQLISRDVALGKDCFAPLPEGSAFISRRGVMEIEGTSVTCISDSIYEQTEMKWDFAETDRLAYDYKSDSLILYNNTVDRAIFYSRSSKTWSGLSWLPSAHLYLWPLLLIVSGNELKLPVLENVETVGKLAADDLRSVESEDTVVLTTRPIKLGSPFAIKKLKRVEGIWPDGGRMPFSVYGSLKPGLWHLIGKSMGGPIRLEGSGWRFFKLEIAVRQPESLDYEKIKSIPKPLIMFEFQQQD